MGPHIPSLALLPLVVLAATLAYVVLAYFSKHLTLCPKEHLLVFHLFETGCPHA